MSAPEGPRPPDVSRETRERLDVFVRLLQRWNATHNLVSRAGDAGDLWQRHVLDSLQLVPLAAGATRWLDLGSGAGFPGLVVAIAGAAQHPGTVVEMIESSHRKVAFLRAAIAATDAPARVTCARIETVLARHEGAVDVITARALAPLAQLIAWCGHRLVGETRALFHKGANYRAEVAAARERWRFTVIEHESVTDAASRILEIGAVSPVRAASTSLPENRTERR